MNISQQQITDYRKNGYILLRGFLDKNVVAQIFRDAREVFAIQIERVLGVAVSESLQMDEEGFSKLVFDLYQKNFATFSNTSKQVQHLVSLHGLGVSEAIITLLKQLGLEKPILSVRPCILMSNKSLDKDGDKGKYWRLPPHQDWYYSQGSLDSVTVWYPYVVANQAIGALQFIPGSHLWGLQKTEDGSYGEMSEDLGDDKFISFDFEPGDLLVFVSLLVHRSGINSTNKIRWSTQFRFNNLLEPTFIERKYPNPFVYQPTRVLETPGFPEQSDLKKLFGSQH